MRFEPASPIGIGLECLACLKVLVLGREDEDALLSTFCPVLPTARLAAAVRVLAGLEVPRETGRFPIVLPLFLGRAHAAQVRLELELANAGAPANCGLGFGRR